MIIFSNVTKKFGDNSPALDEVSFTIDEGDLAIITGPSGSGKTSLMRLLTKEYSPTEGEITFHDTPLSSITTSQLPNHRRKIGVVFQDYKLLHDLNVWENIALALSIIGASPAETEKRVTDLLKLVDIADKAFLFPSQLSGGEAQRVSIARALSTAPKVIFADEPTGNLDPATSQNIIKLLEKINSLGTTILITTHDPVVLDVMNKARHLKLDKGKLIHDSRPSKKKTSTESIDDANDDSADKDNQEIDQEAEQAEKKSAKKQKNNKKDDSKEDTKTENKTKKRVNFKLPSFFSPFKKTSKNDTNKKTEEIDENEEEEKEPDNE
jgi:cell division transport system ATP-binding protein